MHIRWAGYSIKYWKTAGNAYGTSGDLQTAFEQSADQRYAAGYLGGTRAIPFSITQLDNFETGSPNSGMGHFDKPLSYAGAALYGFAPSSAVTRDAGANYSKQWGQKIQVNWNGDSRGWVIRHASGTTSPASNVQIPIAASPSGNESIGFFLRTAASGQQDAGSVGAERPSREACGDVECFGDARRGEQVPRTIEEASGPWRGWECRFDRTGFDIGMDRGFGRHGASLAGGWLTLNI